MSSSVICKIIPNPILPFETQILNLLNDPVVTRTCTLWRTNECVAFPTETVYGLGANALEDEAVKKVFEAKGRPADNPLIVHIAEIEQMEELAEEGAITEDVKKFAKEFWPGPLSMVVKVKPNLISRYVTAGLSTVAFRMPAHPVARALLLASKLPIAAPSANLSGRPSPTKAEHVFNDLGTKIPLIVDGGSSSIGLESTVLDVSKKPYTLLRPGSITQIMLARIAPVRAHASLVKTEHSNHDFENIVPIAPGMKYRHYSPSCPLLTLPYELLVSVVISLRDKGLRVGLMIAEAIEIPGVIVEQCGTRDNLLSVSCKLYDAIRILDAVSPPLQIIVAESFLEEDMGVAIMNRLDKAASSSDWKKSFHTESTESIVNSILKSIE